MKAFGSVLFTRQVIGLQRPTPTRLNDLPERTRAMIDDLSSLHLVATVLRGKWTLPVVYSLKHHTRRYGEIRRHLPTATEKMLISTLRKLEKNGLVKRHIYPSVPPKVEYKLTPFGLEVLEIAKKTNELAKSSSAIKSIKEAQCGLFS